MTIPPGAVTVHAPRSAAAAGVNWATWFDHFWLAKGAASLAASYVDLVGAADLTTAASPALGADGWEFNGSTQYLDTGVIPLCAGTVMVRFSNATSSDSIAVVGANDPIYLIKPRAAGDYWVIYWMANKSMGRTPPLSAGVLAVSNQQPYRNGSPDGKPGDSGPDGAYSMYIGAMNNYRHPAWFFAGNVQAVGMKATSLTGAQVAAASAAMAAL